MKYLLLCSSILILVIVNLLIGSVDIPLKSICLILLGDTSQSEIWQNIIWKSRLPQALTAIVAGAGLAVSGLQMQTVFRNPLAGPSVLGISNGSALGVAFVVLLSGRIGGVALSRLGYLGDAAMSVAAIVGALAVMLLIAARILFPLLRGQASIGALSSSTTCYAVLIAVQFVLRVLIAPAMTSGAIAGERERQTLELLLVTNTSLKRLA